MVIEVVSKQDILIKPAFINLQD